MLRDHVTIGGVGVTVTVLVASLVLVNVSALVVVIVLMASVSLDEVRRVVLVGGGLIDEVFDLCVGFGAGGLPVAPAWQLSTHTSGLEQSLPVLHWPQMVHYVDSKSHGCAKG